MEYVDFQHVDGGNAAKLYDVAVEEQGSETAIATRNRTITHAELDEWAGRFAGGLHERGLQPDDRLLVYLPNCPEFLVALFGGLRAGTPVSPANPQYRARELTHQLTDSDARAVVTHESLRDILEEALENSDTKPLVITVSNSTENGSSESAARDSVETDTESGNTETTEDVAFESVDAEPICVERTDDDVATQLYTSGTTGKPKGVLSTHRSLRAQAFTGLHSEVEPDEDRVLVYLPLYHTTGVYHCTWQPLIRGGEVHLRSPSDWDPQAAMADIEAHEITSFNGVTTMYVDMVNHESFGEYDLTSLRYAGEGGAKMSVTVQEEFETVAGVGMYEGYGLTETSGATHAGAGSTFGPRLGTVGQPYRMTDCKIVDVEGNEVPPGEEGELLIRGPHVMKGYHDLPKATEAAFTETGYFRTGDIARCDEDNYYEIIGRSKDVIVSAGYNIYPAEVEDLLREHEAVADAAVIGIDDERRNEVPKAYVVLRQGVDVDADISEDDIKEFALEHLAAYKHPREVEFIEELPRTASGKVRKFELKEQETSR